MTYPLGIDISSWQTSSDGKQKPDFGIINQKCTFIAIRAGISWGYTDRWFSSYWEQTEIPRMAYHVVYPGEVAVRQMDHFLGIVRPTEHDRLVLDMELDHGYSKARITQTLLECLEHILENTGRYPVIYSRADWINQFVYVSQLPPNLDWWLAGYLKPLPSPLYTREATPPPALPIGVSTWLIHQTAERGNGKEFGVASHYVDIDRWNGTKADIETYFGLAEVPEPPTTPPEIPAPPEIELFKARVYSWATPHVNIRKYPRVAPPDLGDVYPNEILSVYEVVTNPEGEIWYRIDRGWVMEKFLQRLDFTPPPLLINIPPLSQRDPRWANELLGYSNLTIGGWGCLATNFAMMIGVTPSEFNARMKQVGGFKGANIYWGMVAVAYPNFEYYRAIDCYLDPAPLAEIDSMLEMNIPVHAHVDFNLATPQVEQHWVLIVGKNLDDYIINDPWDGEQVSFRARYGDPARYIFRVRAYRRKA